MCDEKNDQAVELDDAELEQADGGTFMSAKLKLTTKTEEGSNPAVDPGSAAKTCFI